MRFKTEAIIGANTAVPPNFRLGQTRKIPGTSKAVDRLRAKVASDEHDSYFSDDRRCYSSSE